MNTAHLQTHREKNAPCISFLSHAKLASKINLPVCLSERSRAFGDTCHIDETSCRYHDLLAADTEPDHHATLIRGPFLVVLRL